MKEINELRLHASGMFRGETVGGISCPWCRGGRNKDKSFSLTKRIDGLVLFICHRAKCGRHGRLNHGEILLNEEQASPFVPREYLEDTRVLTTAEYTSLYASYGLSPADIMDHRLAMEVRSGRLVIPVMSPKLKLRGYEARLMPDVESEAPKTLHYKEIDEPWLGWFAGPTQGVVVIVEDVISAIRVSSLYTSASLMGSHITMDDMMELVGYTDDLVLCLDRDATAKSLKFKQRFQYVAPKLEVRILENDLKYSSDDEITRLVHGQGA